MTYFISLASCKYVAVITTVLLFEFMFLGHNIQYRYAYQCDLYMYKDHTGTNIVGKKSVMGITTFLSGLTVFVFDM